MTLVRERVGGDSKVYAHRRKFRRLRGKVDAEYGCDFSEQCIIRAEECWVGYMVDGWEDNVRLVKRQEALCIVGWGDT